MGVKANEINVKLEAVRAFWGREECRAVSFVADVAGSVAGEQWEVNAISDEEGTEVKYLAYLDDGIVSIPSPAIDQTLMPVSYSQDDSATVIAAAYEAAILATGNFKIIGTSTNKVIVENKHLGPVTEEIYTGAPSLSFENLVVGIGGDLGATAQGGSSLSIDTQTFEIKSDQTAENLLGEIFTGFNAGIEMPLIEVTPERWETIIGSVVGDTHTPAGGTKLVGIGESKLYQNAVQYAGKLILHPIRNAISDKSEDIILWKTSPVPNDVNFSGTDQQVMNVSFKAYLDQNVVSSINLLAFGDHTQEL